MMTLIIDKNTNSKSLKCHTMALKEYKQILEKVQYSEELEYVG